jgi:mannitol/fructose-specific phosphotransferase system IIA component
VTAAAEGPIVEALVPRAYASKRAVIEAIGEAMVGAAAVTDAYVQSMLRKEMNGGTLVAPEIALPHGTADARSAVLRNVLVVAPIPDGVEWATGKTVRLAIGFAGTGDDAHLRLMGTVARVLADADLVERLKAGDLACAAADLFAQPSSNKRRE